MKKTIEYKVTAILFAVIIFGLTFFGVFLKDNEFSLSERRLLADFPEITVETIKNGNAMKDFSAYMADQFPLRDGFRSVKAYLLNYLYLQKDNNGVYNVDGSLSKFDYLLNEKSVEGFISKIKRVERMYLNDTNKTYFALIPDKNYFLAYENGYPSYDYEFMKNKLNNGLSDTMTVVDIFSALSADDYYKTDSHWKSENLKGVTDILADKMGFSDRITDCRIMTLDKPFYGVYNGQSALNLPAETIFYPVNEAIENAVVNDLDKGKIGGVYWGEGDERDRYTFFLNGSSSLLTIENKLAKTDKELILFRDSFGSALAPWLVEAYSKITVVDIRYIQPEVLDRFITFENADVLFLYSSGVVNNSETLK